jgi:hypothetical protein
MTPFPHPSSRIVLTGMFICQMAETLSREKLAFKQGDIPFLRKRMMWEVSNGQLLT